jgi:hypothetical protein
VNNWKKYIIWIVIAVTFQLSTYLYLDRVLLAPASSFQTSDSDESLVITGKTYYSPDGSYVASVDNTTVKIYALPSKKLVRTINLGTKKVSYFRWLEDRNIALMGLHEDDKDSSKVMLTQINPTRTDEALSTTIEKLPVGSHITDIACSTATNVVYIQIQTVTTPIPLFRVYRIDANYDLQRIYFNTERLGRIGVLFDQDSLIFEDRKKDTILVRHGNGSWHVISPPQGKYRLVGVDGKNNIYIAGLNSQGLAEHLYVGQLGKDFTLNRNFIIPMDPNTLNLADVLNTSK